ncbi:ParB/RepB/Spo0J family partition protein [Nitrosospira briensis]|uniref:ParB/RepB/Spo0J family partition protein n=1 Tax=Nitrosospira briensis TaxID=35799 RepID=UPI00046AB480|nr:ParB/RepB/Spo0J family partition protein [Nitrosospira briensis]
MIQQFINSPDLAHQAVLPLDKIERSITNPRKRFEGSMITELAASIGKVGVLQPILVRPHPVRDDKYEIVAGECRYRGAMMAGLETIPAIIRDLTDLEALELQVLENLHRNDLHPLEEAEGFQQLLDANGYTVEILASKLGKSKATVYASLKLCALCPAGREAFYDGKLTASTALLVARIPGAKLQATALKEITKPGYSNALPSYRDAVNMIRTRYTLDLERAIFDIDDANLVEAAGDCQSCEKRSGNCREIYSDIVSADVCTDPDCYAEKRQAHIDRLRQDPNTITGDAAREIIPTGEYYIEDENFAHRHDYRVREIAALLGDDLPTRTLLLKDTPATLVDLAAAQQLIKERGLEIPAEDDTPARLSPYQIEQRARELIQKVEVERRMRLFAALHQRLGDAAVREKALIVVIPMMITAFWDQLPLTETERLFAARGEEDWLSNNDEKGTLYEEAFRDKSPRELSQLLLELFAANADNYVLDVPRCYGSDNEINYAPNNFYTILRAVGIDPDAPLTPETDETPTDPTPTDPTSAAHAAEEIAREENPADETQPGAQPAAQADEPAAEAQPEATPIEAAESAAQADEPAAETQPDATPIQAAEKPAAKKRGRPRKQPVETPVAAVAP